MSLAALFPKRCGPIGVDIGSRSIKLLQFDAAQAAVREAVRWDMPSDAPGSSAQQDDRVNDALRRAREGRNFRGCDAVLCVGGEHLWAQNIRIPQGDSSKTAAAVRSEAGARLPFVLEEAELRYVEIDDVKQANATRREVVALACHRPSLNRLASVAKRAGLRPVAIDAAPAAMLRCYGRQLRRETDQLQRRMFVGVGATGTTVLIAQGDAAMVVKRIDLGGRHFDEAVSKCLKLAIGDAASLRRHDGDRAADQRDPEIAQGINDAIYPLFDRLAQELSLCARYHSVTFRGQPLSRVILGGGEAGSALAERIANRLGVPCELGNPLRPFRHEHIAGRLSQWDVAAGLALRPTQ
jgi:type IV pilus assembly protein PilM